MLTTEEAELLREVVWRREPSLLRLLEVIGRTPLTTVQREALREILADELCETGLRADDEPNERGLKIDDLIGRLMYF